MKKELNKYFIHIIFFIIIFILILYFINKKNKTGNNTSSQEMENIFNINSYELISEVEIKSNKNTNKYLIKQSYQKKNQEGKEVLKQEILEPSNIKGVKITKIDKELKIENTQMNLNKIYENYKDLSKNSLDLINFIKEYKADSNSKEESKENYKILETENKILYLNKQDNKPVKMVIQDNNKTTKIYILYKEVNINDKSDHT